MKRLLDRLLRRIPGLRGRVASEAGPEVPFPSPVAATGALAMNEDPGGGANDSHEPLDLDAVVKPLLPASAWRLFEKEGCGGGEYALEAGDGDRRRLVFLGGIELLRELAFDADVTVPEPSSWREALVPGRFAYLLIETTWEVVGGDWGYALVADGPGRSETDKVLAHCREIGLPVVVWFREDVSNYERFAWLAGRADRVYAVDTDIVQRLRNDYPSIPSGHLPVAIQPAVHNPLRHESVARDAMALRESVLFDGWWDLIAGGKDRPLLLALQQQGLLVAESEWDYANAHLEDCPGYGARAVGSLSPASRLAIGKLCPVEIFLERSVNLPWRDAQRILRSAAAGCMPVQLGAGESLIDGIELPVRGADDTLLSQLRAWLANPALRARSSQRILRALLDGHCLSHRLRRIERDLGISAGEEEGALPEVACILVTRRPGLLPGCLAWFRRERYPNKALIVVVHDNDCDMRVLEAQIAPGERVRLLRMGRERSLGSCLNFAISLSEAPYWAKIDDDDFYGEHYLSDLMLYRRIRDFDIIGKPPQFLYMEAGDELRWDQAWHDHAWLLHKADGPRAVQVAGATLLGRREAWDAVRFSSRRRSGSDSEFIMRCYEQGYDLMAADGFNFAQFRSARPGFHTWKVADSELRSRSVQLGDRNVMSGIVFV